MTENLNEQINESTQRKLERVSNKKFNSFEAAKANQQSLLAAKPEPAKVKIFARHDGSFDVVTYQKIQTKQQEMAAAEVKKKTAKAKKKV